MPTDRALLDRMEAEANLFAIELLMPADWVRRDAKGIDLLDDAAVAKLAKRYGVTSSLMAARIGQLFEQSKPKRKSKRVPAPLTSGQSNGDPQ